jgi:hypothetical protein
MSSFLVDGQACDQDCEALERIRALIHRLRPDWRDARGFYELKSEATGALTRLIRLTARSPRPLTRADGLAVPGRTAPVRALRSPYTAPGLRARSEAARDFPAPVASPEPETPGLILSPPPEELPDPPAPAPKRPGPSLVRSRRRHRYPRPPPDLPGQGSLL